MTPVEAVQAIIALSGGTTYLGRCHYRFPTLKAADRCKAILDALLPEGSTGAVFADGRLIVDNLLAAQPRR